MDLSPSLNLPSKCIATTANTLDKLDQPLSPTSNEQQQQQQQRDEQLQQGISNHQDHLNSQQIQLSTPQPSTKSTQEYSNVMDVNNDFIYNKHNESIFDDSRYFPSLQPTADPNLSPVVKFDDANSELINHATLKALLVQLTSPEVIDYNLICDFFLTYRIFADSESVLNLLLTRLIWSLQYIRSNLESNIKIGKLVLLRTFVVLRHWLLNYFIDDFEPNPNLCDIFIFNINKITNESKLINNSMLFEKKIICDLKIHWISSINEFWNLDIDVEALITKKDVLFFKLPLVSQISSKKKLTKTNTESSIHTNPSYRRSAMLSLYDQKIQHKCLILDDENSSDENPQFSVNNLLLHHHSSRTSLNFKLKELQDKKFKPLNVETKDMKTHNANSKHNHMNLKDSSLGLKKTSSKINNANTTNNHDQSFKSPSDNNDDINLTSINEVSSPRSTAQEQLLQDVGFSTNGNIRLPSSRVQTIVPPTPAKKMEYILKNSLTGSPKRKNSSLLKSSPNNNNNDYDNDMTRKRSIKTLVDGWKKTFNHNKSNSQPSASISANNTPTNHSHNHSQITTRSVSTADLHTLINNAMNVMTEEEESKIGDRVDILSARIIDELEYIIRYYINNQLSPNDTINENDNESLGQISFNQNTIHQSNNDKFNFDTVSVANDEFVDVLNDDIDNDIDDLNSIEILGSPTKKSIRNPNSFNLNRFQSQISQINRLSTSDEVSPKLKALSSENDQPIREGNDNLLISQHQRQKQEDEDDEEKEGMNICDLSDLNIGKIDNLINTEKESEENKENDNDYNFSKESSFQRPISLNWNNEEDVNFDDFQASSNETSIDETNVTNNLGQSRLVKSSTQYFDVSSELPSEQQQLPEFNDRSTEPSNQSNQSFGSSISTPSNITQYDAEIEDLGIALSPISMKKENTTITTRKISFSEPVVNNQSTISGGKRISRNSGSSIFKRDHDSIKSYVSYDSAFSVSNGSTSQINTNGDDQAWNDKGLRKKAGFANIRNAIEGDSNDMYINKSRDSDISRQSSNEVNSLDLPVKVKATSSSSIASRSSLINKKSIRKSTLFALAELPFTNTYNESNYSIYVDNDKLNSSNNCVKRNSVLPERLSQLTESDNGSFVMKSKQSSIKSVLKNKVNKDDNTDNKNKTPSLNSSTNSVVIPGISNFVLKELAAIPDESFKSNNPVEFALYKLEGKRSISKTKTNEVSQIKLDPETNNPDEDKDKTENGNQENHKNSVGEEDIVTNTAPENDTSDDVQDILNEINNADTQDVIDYSSDITQEAPLTPVKSKSKLLITKDLPFSSSPEKTHNKNNSENNENIFFFAGSLNNTPDNNITNSFILPTPKIILDGYNISSDLLSVMNVMSSNSHISFVLSYDSKSLATHFTIIEKDMLQEIDWKELIELKWNKELTPVNSWLEIMVNETYYNKNKGVNLVISRFNLMVNWIISEILLTKNQFERINIISRFIHIAQNCFVLQNFSTLMQIILALTSEKIQKLKNTWKNLSPGDILMLKNLEDLSSPLRNFLNIRLSINQIKPSKGCIPFVGLYLSDLIFNAERPKYIKNPSKVNNNNTGPNQTSPSNVNNALSPPPIPSNINDDLQSVDTSSLSSLMNSSTHTVIGPNNEADRMINFSRFRTSVHIVKSLSQCIEWSTSYKLKVNHELLSKCLYIKSLDEEEMNYCLTKITD